MRASRFVLKDPNAVEPQGFDWTDWLASVGPAEKLSTSSWTVSGPDAALTLSGASITTDELRAQVLLTGGTAGGRYRVTNRVTSTGGYTDDDTLIIIVRER